MTEEEKKQAHLATVAEHIRYVQELCDKMGIHELGQEHDKSKYSPEEMPIAHWYTGTKSPHDTCRAELGYSPGWCYHKARNPHHWEFWTDFNEATPNGDGTFTIICKCVKMPYERVIEMLCDQWGASKTYNKETFSLKAPLDYYKNKCEGQRAMYPASEALLKRLINQLADSKSEEDFINWYNSNKETLQKKYEKDSLVY